MKVTARIIAEVEPTIKEKLVELSSKNGKSMTQNISELIEVAHKKINK